LGDWQTSIRRVITPCIDVRADGLSVGTSDAKNLRRLFEPVLAALD
jgi:hypothetical protein